MSFTENQMLTFVTLTLCVCVCKQQMLGFHFGGVLNYL